MNKYIQQMKNALNTYYNAAKAAESEKEKARNIYQHDVAEAQSQKIDSDLWNKKQVAIDTIVNAKDDGIAEAKRWGVLDGNKINDGDMKLLKFDLSPEQFETIVERNRNNGTMCFILKQYAEKHGRKEMKQDEVPEWNELATVTIPTVEEKTKAYEIFYNSAIGIIENMSGYGWGKGVDGFGVESTVKSFGEPNQMNYTLLEVLGG